MIDDDGGEERQGVKDRGVCNCMPCHTFGLLKSEPVWDATLTTQQEWW